MPKLLFPYFNPFYLISSKDFCNSKGSVYGLECSFYPIIGIFITKIGHYTSSNKFV